MRFEVSPELFELLPDAVFGVVAVRGADNSREYPEISALLRSAAVPDCCFYNNYIKGQIRGALWDIREKSRHMRGVVSYETIYRAVVIKLNPDMRDVLNITGLDESERRRMEAVAKKFDLELE